MKVAEILSKLVGFKTLSTNFEENLACLNWVKDFLQSNCPAAPVEIITSNGFPSLIFTTRKTKTPKVWLVCHIDVVHGSESVFKAVVKNGRLYGRGTFDMKFAAACYLRMVEELKEKCLNYDFGLMLTTDEEIGGENGVKCLLESGYSSDLAFLPDGGKNWLMEIGAKGARHIKITASGKSAHGSRTWLGENAILKLAKFLMALQNEFLKEPCGDESHWHPTCNIGQIKGGKSTNQVPDYAEAQIDIRFRDEVEGAAIDKTLLKLSEKFGVCVFTEMSGASYKASADDKYIRVFSELAVDKFGIKTGTIVSHGTSDGRYFSERKIPLVMSRPMGDGHHTEEEWVDIADLGRFCEIAKEFVLAVSK